MSSLVLVVPISLSGCRRSFAYGVSDFDAYALGVDCAAALAEPALCP